MRYTVVNNKKVLGSFDEKELAEMFAKVYTVATGTEVEIRDTQKTEEPKAEEPKVMEISPIAYAVDNGMAALEELLKSYSIDQLKLLIKTYYLDPNRTYSRSKNLEKLRAGILNRVEARATHGDVFQNFEG